MGLSKIWVLAESFEGKVVGGVVEMATELDVPCLVIAGEDDGVETLRAQFIDHGAGLRADVGEHADDAFANERVVVHDEIGVSADCRFLCAHGVPCWPQFKGPQRDYFVTKV